MQPNLGLAGFSFFGRFRRFRPIFCSSRFRLISIDFTISRLYFSCLTSHFLHLPLVIFTSSSPISRSLLPHFLVTHTSFSHQSHFYQPRLICHFRPIFGHFSRFSQFRLFSSFQPISAIFGHFSDFPDFPKVFVIEAKKASKSVKIRTSRISSVKTRL